MSVMKYVVVSQGADVAADHDGALGAGLPHHLHLQPAVLREGTSAVY